MIAVIEHTHPLSITMSSASLRLCERILQMSAVGTLLVVFVGLGSTAAEPERVPITLDPIVRSRCLDVLREGLTGRDFWPAMHAAEGLSAAGFGEELQPLLREKLSTETDDQRRCGLARELVRAGDRGYVAILLDVLSAPDTYGHAHAAESLFKVHEIGDGEALRGAMQRDEYPRVRVMAAAALARAGNQEALPVLREQLVGEDRELSRTAAWVLGRVGEESDIPAIRAQMTRSDDPLTIAYFEHALAALGDPDGRAALISNLSHTDPHVRTYAAEFVPDAWVEEAVPRLVEMLEDPHPDARIRAAHALLVLAQAPE
jgi:sialidase-1